MLLIQLLIVFLLGFFFTTTFRASVQRNSMLNSCASDINLCRPEWRPPHEAKVFKETIHQATIANQAPIALSQKQQKQQQQLAPPTFPYTIITGSSANHLCALENFLYALNKLRPELDPSEFPRIAVYNIGMNRTQLPVLDQLQSNGLIDDVVTLDYYKYPRFWDVAINAGEYAWKTGIVHEARIRYGGTLIWLDAGNIVTTDFLRYIPSIVRQSGGFWSPRSSYMMARWTHPGMYKYYDASPEEYARNINCNGAAIGFDTTNQTIVDTIMEPWYECGLVKNCIAPAGSSRINHRQDQAALTFLAYRSGHSCKRIPSRYHNLQVHRDVSCRATLLELELQGMLSHPSAIDTPKWERSDTLALFSHPEWRYPQDKVPSHIGKLLSPIENENEDENAGVEGESEVEVKV
ncbi:hypothetical protein J3Q64DRAFT_1703579 [Phycomyces blakesleeanus]|uniref:Glycosyltransferase family 71 protein n=2 Tax=Phycomyces blakesleeanus TaxID=4837 RepID=A0A163DJH1_PHYB8|nr:hypothetical protein PHYBLDRAFT_69981 [Phycomyces blakesleeanus NRRL 1555(-)]OAD71680.1 hypothetical protein PHYBLDRAFT_69981 [Phycomyces blakesleeanus NRRL 1555(-)]|eukprot:XP_018289720.1 hypothetical protein PHYBLDRAFT_69981 [Phycomyces blakesleeanus NRRL 1555(-)]